MCRVVSLKVVRLFINAVISQMRVHIFEGRLLVVVGLSGKPYQSFVVDIYSKRVYTSE